MNFDCHCGWEGDHFGAAEHSKDTSHDPLGMGAHGGCFWSELVDAHRRDLWAELAATEDYSSLIASSERRDPNEEDDPETTTGGWYD